MKNTKRVLIVSVILALILAGLHFGIIFLLPKFLNSANTQNLAKDFIYKKYGTELIVDNFFISVSPNLNSSIKVSNLGFYKDDEELLLIKKINVKSTFKKIKRVDAEYIFADMVKIQGIFSDKKKKNGFNFAKLPEICIKSGDITFNDFNFKILDFNLLNTVSNNSKKKLILRGEGKSAFLSDKIILDGKFSLDKSTLISNNTDIIIKNVILNIDGVILNNKKGANYNITGEKLPIDEIMAGLLYFQKSKDSSKKFIENFKNYSGSLDVDLNIKKDKIFGKLIADKLTAKTVLFNVPIEFKTAEFYFDGDDLNSSAAGTLAGEKVVHILHIKNVKNKEREVFGEVHSRLTEKAAGYVPGLDIIESVQASVDYHIKNKKIDVNYSLDIKKGADILYKGAYLGLLDKDRRLFIETLKEKDLYIKNYDYSIITGGQKNIIISGDGLFVKMANKNGVEHLYPKYLSAKTNGFAPASFTGSFGKYIEGGEFKGNLKYDFLQKLILGDFIVRNFTHKDFYVDEAKISANNDFINILANGKYRGSNFTCKMNGKNIIGDKIEIYTMDLFLEKYIFKTLKHRKERHLDSKNDSIRKKNKYSKYLNKVKDINLTVDRWTIRVNKLIKDRIHLENILLSGSLKEDIFNFKTADIFFADGILAADGNYDFKNNTSEIDFEAKGINSNLAADLLFNLRGQVEGIADGNLKIKTSNKFHNIKAYTTFKINNGNLTRLGDIEFTTKRGRKVKISDIINVKMNENKGLNSNLNGNFYFDNYKLHNINITSQQKYLSFLIKGDFDIQNDDADLMLFGKYNSRAGKGVKILFMPINFIIKLVLKPENTLSKYKPILDKIPFIEGKKEDINFFRVKFKGNLNNKINLEMKSIVE